MNFAPATAGVYRAATTADRAARYPTPFTGQLVLMEDTDTLVRYTGTAWEVALGGGVQALTDAATIAVDAILANIFTVILSGNRTMGAPTNFRTGVRYTFHIIQDGSGGRTLAWNAVFKFGTAWSNTGNTLALKSTVEFISFDGTTLEQVGSQVAYH